MKRAYFQFNRIVVWLLALFLLNSSYLFSFSDPTLAYVVNMVIPVIGGWVCVVLSLFVWQRLCPNFGLIRTTLEDAAGH